jgi:hypothetical protein
MTESAGFPPATPAAPVSQAEAVAAAQQQLADAAAELRKDGGSEDASATAQAQMREQVTRDVLLPMETKFDAFMADYAKRSEAQDAELVALRAQLAGAQAAAGTPDVIKYAEAVRDRIHNAAELSGQPKEIWAPILDTVDKLAADAKTAMQDQDPGLLDKGIAAVERYITKTYPRLSGQTIEHFPTVLADLDELVSAGERLAPLALEAV